MECSCDANKLLISTKNLCFRRVIETDSASPFDDASAANFRPKSFI